MCDPSTATERDKRVYIAGLIFSCPFQNALNDCPLEPYRQKYKNLKERYDFVQALNINEITDIIKHHKRCVEKREKYNNDLNFW